MQEKRAGTEQTSEEKRLRAGWHSEIVAFADG